MPIHSTGSRGPCLEDQADERQRKAGDGPGIAGLRAMDLGERRLRQAAAQGGIETLDASAQKRIRQRRGDATPDNCDIGRDIGVKRRAGRRRPGARTAVPRSSRFGGAGQKRSPAPRRLSP